METKICTCCNQEKPVSEFNKNGWGYKSVCRECEKKHREEKKLERKKLQQQAVDAKNARQLRLEEFTARELFVELKRRGYEFKATYTEVRTIDSKDF